MKKQNIGVGRFYSDGKGGLREVIAEGPEHKLYESVADDDCLRYKSYVSSGGIPAGTENNTTRTSFAAWAKFEITNEDVDQWLLQRQATSVATKLTAPQKSFLNSFDRDLNLKSYISCPREEYRLAKACREKGLLLDVPDTLTRDHADFEVTFTALGLAVLKQVHAA
ncbi:hypothetical protein [Pseudomonas mosselii]|uniref:hypothetical protein n=1 Tax=Pseudomonas mosselii TaxID=78327 RepID=UPI0021D9A81A|nr:hypothetical protein [Pseudomonas mosselii]MCU9529381.1 hypothetical protein [Pseudomonas mosselii]MCU9536672.1 hypothetical protein [Pseudomonas mosselii]MCU9542293.1 hypothetical protein [Pseudomonas mosselii]MCU9548397.1 hypothetical protein [Pseudomonas mosselii]